MHRSCYKKSAKYCAGTERRQACLRRGKIQELDGNNPPVTGHRMPSLPTICVAIGEHYPLTPQPPYGRRPCVASLIRTSCTSLSCNDIDDVRVSRSRQVDHHLKYGAIYRRYCLLDDAVLAVPPCAGKLCALITTFRLCLQLKSLVGIDGDRPAARLLPAQRTRAAAFVINVA